MAGNIASIQLKCVQMNFRRDRYTLGHIFSLIAYKTLGKPVIILYLIS